MGPIARALIGRYLRVGVILLIFAVVAIGGSIYFTKNVSSWIIPAGAGTYVTYRLGRWLLS